MYGTALQLHTCKVNIHVCKWIFKQVIKPNPSSRGNLLENLLNLVSICFFSSYKAMFESFSEQLPLNAIE